VIAHYARTRDAPPGVIRIARLAKRVVGALP
jgi:hypothetical protein